MSKNAFIVVIVLLIFVILGLTVFGITTMINQKSSSKLGGVSNGGQTNANPPPVTTQADFDAFSKQFRDAFEAWHDMDHCTVLRQADQLTTAQLQQFSNSYYSLYGVTVTQQMDNAWSWCFGDNVGQRVYNKLKAL